MYAVTERYSENIAKNAHFTSVVGSLTLKDGTVSEFGDRDILENSLSINSKMNSAGEFRMGGVYSSELSMTLMDFSGKISALDRAVLTLEFRLHTDSTFTDYDPVPLGTYYIDASTIKRKDSGRVSFKALDSLVLFDKRCAALSGTLFYLVTAACGVCGVELGMTEEEFTALPNGSLTAQIDTTRVQTWRDLLGYIAALTGSFVRVSRLNRLEFVQITCEKDEDNHIIPVRDILGTVRFDTEFSDSYEQITRLVMLRNDALLSSTIEFSGSNSENYLTVELLENPLLSAFTDEEAAEILNETVRGVYRCHSRAFSAAFSGDPALEVGDYVRFRRGDTASGSYSTGMITVQTWKYRGQHSISCTMPTSVSSETEAYTQPKSQTEKRIDALEAGGTGGDTFNNPILILQKDIVNLLHEYSVLEYLDNYKIVYAGAQNQIIAGGYIFFNADAITPEDTTPLYQNMTFEGYGTTSEVLGNLSISVKIINVNKNGVVTLKVYSNGEVVSTISTYNVNSVGFVAIWSYIYSPDAYPELYPNGGALASIVCVYTNISGNNTRASTVGSRIFPFGSISEFNSAVGLTLEPEYKETVSERIIPVSDTSISDEDALEIIAAANAYTDERFSTANTNLETVSAVFNSSIATTNTNVTANTLAIAENSAAIAKINDVDTGILALANAYTDTTADTLREELGGTE